MTRIFRKIVVLTAIAAFLLSSANVFLYIHLAEHKHDAHGHDSGHCPICQQAAINKTKAIIEIDSLKEDLLPIVFTDIKITKVFVQNSDFSLPLLRAPPASI
jgi:hypothetical protein